jgi:transcriptional regulator with XRE-family HTH domain
VNTSDETDREVKELLTLLGAEIRHRRKNVGMTLADVAEISGVSLAFVSQVENGSAPSLDTLHRIARAIGTTIPGLMKEKGSVAPATIVTRRGKGKAHYLVDGATTRLVAGGAGHYMEAAETLATPGMDMDEPFVHGGEDLILMLEGTVEMEVDGDDAVLLSEGDVIMYLAEKPHLWRVVGDKPARMLYVNAPGSF